MIDPVSREHYLPIRNSDLIEVLLGDPTLTAAERGAFRRLAAGIQQAIHREFQPHLEQLKNDYAGFDPDADTADLVPLSPDQARLRLDRLFETFIWLLERANFQRLTADDLHRSLLGSNWWGLNVEIDLSVFDRLEVFVRGSGVQARHRRRFRRLFRREEVQLPVYRRLVVILRLKDHPRLGKDIDTDSVFIKMFKDIPTMDLEMLLPGIRIKMSLLDRGKIGLPMLMGLGMAAWRLTGGMLLTLAAGLTNTFAMLGIAGGTIGYAIRAFYGYVRTKEKYRLTVYENLYFQSLASNRACLFHLCDKAEEQECREAILAYYFLWRFPSSEGYSTDELDARVEKYLLELLGRQPDFEVADALAKLCRLKLATATDGQRYQAVGITDALAALGVTPDA